MRREQTGKVTLREQILLLLAKDVRLNTMEIARHIGKHYQPVRSRLFELKKLGLVHDEMVRRYMPRRRWVLVHEWWISKEGKEWLQKAGLLSS